MITHLADRIRYALHAVAMIGVGLWVHRGGAGLGPDARDITGDALWAAMIVWWVSVVAPRRSLPGRAAVALAICFAVEVSQFLHTPALDALRETTLGRLVLGSGFDARDLLAYAGGVLAAVVLDVVRSRRSRGRRS